MCACVRVCVLCACACVCVRACMCVCVVRLCDDACVSVFGMVYSSGIFAARKSILRALNGN